MSNDDPGDAGLELDGCCRPARRSTNSRTVAGCATDERISATASTDSPRFASTGRQPLDQDLVRRAEADQPRLDADVAGRGERRLGLSAAARVVAVRQQDDALLGVVREQRRGQPQGGADVGRRADRRRGEAVDLAEVRRQALDERLLAEGDDAGHVAVGDDVERLAQERQRVLATLVADRVGQVDDEDRGQAVDRQHDPEPGQREHERDQQDGPDDEGEAPSPGPDATARPQVQPDRERHRRDQQQQRERGLEG